MKASLKRKILIGIVSTPGLLFLVVLVWHLYFISQFIVYQDDQYNFSIKYPKTWTVKAHPQANVAVIFLRPKDTGFDTLQENFNVTVQPLPVGIVTLEEFSDRIKAQMISVFGKSTRFVQYKPLRWGFLKGSQLSIEALKPDNLKMINAWLLYGNHAYIMTFLGNINKYSDDFLVVSEMIRSLKLQ